MEAVKGEWDVFISHASEDKELVAQPLAVALKNYGIRVWYDEFSLEVGDSLSRAIDKGLSKSQYGLVILSQAFFRKRWPEYELRGLTAREMVAGKVILPVWHDVTLQEVIDFSPPLADKFALRAENLSSNQLAVKIIEIIKPELFSRIHKRMAYLRVVMSKDNIPQMIAASALRSSPIRHQTLPPDLVGRIRLIRASLFSVYCHSMEFWLDGFRRDAHPSGEIILWEHLSASFLEYLAIEELDETQCKLIFKALLMLMNQGGINLSPQELSSLPSGAKEQIENIWTHSLPFYDFHDDLPNKENSEDQQIPIDRYRGDVDLSYEEFPDLPNDMIMDLLGESVGDAP